MVIIDVSSRNTVMQTIKNILNLPANQQEEYIIELTDKLYEKGWNDGAQEVSNDIFSRI